MSQKTVRCDSNICKGVSQELGVEITWNSTGETEEIHGCARMKSSDETWTDLLQYLLVVTDHDLALCTVPAAQFPSYQI